MLGLIGSALGAGASLLGGMFGANATSAANAQSLAAQKEANQNSIQWRVADANKAGISPIYALGSPGMSAGSMVGDPGASISSAWSGAGQNIARGVQAYADQQTSNSAFAKSVQVLTLQKMGLENELLASNIRLANQPGNGPQLTKSPLIAGQQVTTSIGTGTDEFTGKPTGFKTDPNASDEQVWENRYGDIIGNIAGAYIGAKDLSHWLIQNGPAYANSVMNWLNARHGGAGYYPAKARWVGK